MHIPSMTCNPNSEKEGPTTVSAPPGALHSVRRPRCCTSQSRNVVAKLSSSGEREGGGLPPLPLPRARLTPGREGGRQAENLCPENCPLYPVANETLSPHFSPSSPLPLISLLLYLFYPLSLYFFFLAPPEIVFLCIAGPIFHV